MKFNTILADKVRELESKHTNIRTLRQQQYSKELELFTNKPFMCHYGQIEPSSAHTSTLVEVIGTDSTSALSAFKLTKNNSELSDGIHQECCFNHIIGLPISANNTTPSPLYQWQYDYLIKQWEQHKYNCVLKATGIGLSELALRWILYKSLVNNNWSNGIVPIVTGVNMDLAKRLIARAAEMVYPFFPEAQENVYTLRVNDVEITAFAGGHMDSLRSLTNTRFFFLDEFDWFEEQKNIESARKTSERYIAKADPGILIASTPNSPTGPMSEILNEEPSLYNKIMLPYEIGLGTIYSRSLIEKQKQSPSFSQEYCLQFLGNIGNIFNPLEIQDAITKSYSLAEDNPHAEIRIMGVDPAFGSSEFGVTIIEKMDKVNVLYSDSWNNQDVQPAVALQRVIELMKKYRCCKCLVDSSRRDVVQNLMYLRGHEFERLDYYNFKEDVVLRWLTNGCKYNKFVPIQFSTKGRLMLSKLMELFSKRMIRINPKFDKLIVSLRTAIGRPEDLVLDKVKTSYSDTLDSIRLACFGLTSIVQG